MRQSPEMRFNRWDGLVILLVVLLAVFSAVTIWGKQEQTDRLTVVVSVDGEEVCILDPNFEKNRFRKYEKQSSFFEGNF